MSGYMSQKFAQAKAPEACALACAKRSSTRLDAVALLMAHPIETQGNRLQRLRSFIHQHSS